MSILQGASNEAAYDFFTQVHEEDDREGEERGDTALASPGVPQGGESHSCSFCHNVLALYNKTITRLFGKFNRKLHMYLIRSICP
jgi:hypothetical protein